MDEYNEYSGARIGVPTPPASENGDGGDVGCPISNCPTEPPASPEQVNNTVTDSPLPPSPPPSIKTRRDRSSLQKEANRSKQFTSRLQRSATTGGNDSDLLGRKKSRGFSRQTTSLPVDHGLKAIEPPHEQALTKMAFAEQQKWITVQQKTFTKWYARR